MSLEIKVMNISNFNNFSTNKQTKNEINPHEQNNPKKEQNGELRSDGNEWLEFPNSGIWYWRNTVTGEWETYPE